MGTGICMCRVDVAQAVRQYGWTLALEPRGMVAMVRYLKRINEENVRVRRQVSSGTDTGFLHGSSFVLRSS